MTTWEKEITEAMAIYGETWADVVVSTLTDEQKSTPFDSGFGGTNGVSFTVWTSKRVYFPGCYDGAEWAESVSRHPNGEPTPHIGGG